MYTADATTISYLTDGSREYDCKIDVYDGGVLSTSVLQSDGTIYPFTFNPSIQASDYFTIGSIHSSGLKIPLASSITIPTNGELRLFFRLNGTSGYGDWIPMGIWFVDNRYSSGDNVVVYQCYDELIRAESTYVSALSYPTTAQAVWNEIIADLDLTTSVTLSSKTISAAISGDTHRVALGDIAGLYGGSVIIDRDGAVDIVYPYANTSSSLTVTNGLWDTFDRIGDSVRTISRVSCIYNTNGDYVTLGDDDDYELVFYSRLITSIDDLQDVFDNYDGITFVPYSKLGWIGDPRLDVGDRVTIVDKDGVTTYDTFIMTTTGSYGGGLSMVNTSTVYSETESEFDVSYGLSKFVRTAVKQGVPYYGVSINTEKGINIQRSDGFSETTINSDTWEVMVEGVKKLWIDFAEGEMMFDGTLSANILEALTAIVTPTLYADYGRIADLTVKSLDTSWTKVLNYLNGNSASDVLYQRMYEDRVEKWVGTPSTNSDPSEFVATINSPTQNTLTWVNPTGLSSTIQYTDIYGQGLYWVENPYPYTGHASAMTTDGVTYPDYPVMVYVYDEYLKEVASIELIDGVYTPITQYGVGTGVSNYGQGFIYKKSDGLYIDYYKATDGTLVQFALTDDGPKGLIPSGGTTGQVLTKLSDDDYDVGWVTP